jgi:RNA:NAD 2'-phosphotransferase (TPT1/KptA family)
VYERIWTEETHPFLEEKPMDPVSKSAALECLENDWSKFVAQCESQTPEAKEKFLQRQGFATYSALLLHIRAWWGEAITNLQGVVANPEFKTRKYDVDRFNAEAVRAGNGKTEEAVIREFEETRIRLLHVISDLNETQIKNGETQKQLYWMICNHYREHQI